MHDLATHINQPLYAAHGIMEMLWHHAGDYAVDGDIGKLTDAAIARGVDWKQDPSVLIEALVKSRFLDRCEPHRLIIHDWPHHAQEWVKKKLRRIQKKKAHEEIDWLEVYIRPAIPSSHSVQPDVELGAEIGNNCRPAIPSSHSVQINPRAGGVREVKEGKGTSGTQLLPPLPPKGGQSQNGVNGKRRRLSKPEILALRQEQQREQEAREFERRYSEWVESNPGRTRDEFADWSIENAGEGVVA